MSIPNIYPYNLKLDTCDLACPLPLLKTKQALSTLPAGDILWVISNQASLSLDIKSLARQSGSLLLKEQQQDEFFHFYIQKVS
jgi:tRNA 2-thiouridine synthesizing protein A